MIKIFCLITAQERFKVNQIINGGRLGFHKSVESIYDKIPNNQFKVLGNYKLMEVSAKSNNIARTPISMMLLPNSNAKVVNIIDLN